MPTKAHDSKAGSKETETKPNIPKEEVLPEVRPVGT